MTGSESRAEAQLRLEALAGLAIARPSTPPPRRRVSRWVVGGCAVLAVAAAVSAHSFAPARPVPVQAVRVAAPPPAASAGSVELVAGGYAMAQRSARIGAKASGRVTRVPVREGDRVMAGAALVELDPQETLRAIDVAQARALAASARVKVARATAGEVELSLRRERKLAAAGASSVATVEDLEARLATLTAGHAAAEAELEAARAELRSLAERRDELTIRAPFDGVVAGRPPEVGELALPSVLLLELIDFDSIEVEAEVPEAQLGKVRDAARAAVVFDAAPDVTLDAVVRAVAPRVSRAKATGTVRLQLLGERPAWLRPDMAGRVRLLGAATVKTPMADRKEGQVLEEKTP